MNEPAVFGSIDKTLPKSTLHFKGREHREIHNIYGHQNAKVTYNALLNRKGNLRPFILSRSFYSGT